MTGSTEGQLPQAVIDARLKFIEADEEASKLEADARRARRRANRHLSRYEALMREHNGQERLPFQEEHQ